MTVFDRGAALHHTGGDAEILREVLEIFLEQGPEKMALVESALARGEAPELEREAHALKGAAATLGMEELRQAAQAVEHLGAAGHLAQAAAPVAEMRAALEAVLAALRAELA